MRFPRDLERRLDARRYAVPASIEMGVVTGGVGFREPHPKASGEMRGVTGGFASPRL